MGGGRFGKRRGEVWKLGSSWVRELGAAEFLGNIMSLVYGGRTNFGVNLHTVHS